MWANRFPSDCLLGRRDCDREDDPSVGVSKDEGDSSPSWDDVGNHSKEYSESHSQSSTLLLSASTPLTAQLSSIRRLDSAPPTKSPPFSRSYPRVHSPPSPLCLVHRSLTRFTQRILFTNVFLPDLVNAQEFLASLELDSDFGGWVKTLEFGRHRHFDVGENDSLLKLVRRCSEVEEVTMLCIDGVNFALFAQLKSQYSPWFVSRCD